MTDLQRLLADAKYEIDGLRRRNEVLSAKVEMIDFFALVLRTSPAYQSVGAGEDVAWKLQQKMDELEKIEKSAPRAA